ncbi:CAP domain-containing protein [Paractinoplanes globisporus]|uniref:CAP domain-containing protein n=1 Tax=Paractinoplanes globisporus TaxID=113565 RepID=A0ABW6WRQ1_9ACTN|nr:CAP domain-containing protein [Actinoplanes globisporus]
MSLPTAARLRYTLVAGATAVVIGTGFTVIGLSRHAEAEPTPAAAVASELPSEEATTPSPSITEAPTPSATPTPKKTTTSPKPRKTTTAPKKTKTTAPVPSTGDNVLDAVLQHINAARADEGLAALTLDTKLSKASALHTQLMINGCGLEHECPGEKGLGDRFSAQGVNWSSAGENIGFGSSGSSEAAIIRAANGLTDSMLAEKPPNDGHRKNLLNTGFKRIGLSIVRDSKGITWMTQDFVN